MLKDDFLSNAFQKLSELYPEGKLYNPIISAERQRFEIERLKSTIYYEQFFFVVNLVERKIENANGLITWLGYPDDDFGFPTYFAAIHPAYLATLDINANAAFNVANAKETPVHFMDNRVVVKLPLKHRDGHYIFVKRTLYPFQFDADGTVMSYLNHFVVLEPYNHTQAVYDRVGQGSDLTTESEKEFQSEKATLFANFRKETLLFTDKEWGILNYMAAHPSHSHREVAEALDINFSTLQRTDNSRILAKLRNYFNDSAAFDKLSNAVVFLKINKLL